MRSGLDEFTVLDWIGLGLVALALLSMSYELAFMAPAFERMYAEFGGALPGSTSLAMAPATRLLIAAICFAPVVGGLAIGRTIRARRIWFASSFAAALILGALHLVALYMPIYAVAGAIK